MKKILLPELVRTKKVGKNLIQHKLYEGEVFQSTSVELKEGYLLVKNNKGEVLCLIQKSKPVPAGFSKVLAAINKVTLENYSDPTLSLTWLKFPGLAEPIEPENVCKSWKEAFHFKEENNSENILGLRKPQIAAIFNVLAHWRVDDDLGTVIMPTGTGKTETMLSLLIAQACPRLLVVVPSDPLRTQIADKFITLGHLQKPDFGIVEPTALKPIVGVLCENFKNTDELLRFIAQCNVIVTTMDLISNGSAR